MRLFIAIDIASEIRDKLAQVQKILNRKGIKPVEEENIHFTLKFLGEVDDRRVEPIKETLKEIKTTPFKMHVKGVGFFPSPKNIRVVWAGVEEGNDEFVKIAEDIDYRMKKFGFGREKNFVAHATIARVKKITAEDRKKIVHELESYLKKDFGWMRVTDFRLKKSVLTPRGPVYSDIGVFELENRDEN
jgi:2'-5' RNA ligase